MFEFGFGLAIAGYALLLLAIRTNLHRKDKKENKKWQMRRAEEQAALKKKYLVE